ncbi:unnamed protein product [Trichogramma brassicae]|uniref:Uncharacterized protein n=1 Tax=Trichogramma brassicae TaxID=86971 RepID=A0A6H5IY92_9HYME|nr:unnamed protein product [Trichogramma brassicae]
MIAKDVKDVQDVQDVEDVKPKKKNIIRSDMILYNYFKIIMEPQDAWEFDFDEEILEEQGEIDDNEEDYVYQDLMIEAGAFIPQNPLNDLLQKDEAIEIIPAQVQMHTMLLSELILQELCKTARLLLLT